MSKAVVLSPPRGSPPAGPALPRRGNETEIPSRDRVDSMTSSGRPTGPDDALLAGDAAASVAGVSAENKDELEYLNSATLTRRREKRRDGFRGGPSPARRTVARATGDVVRRLADPSRRRESRRARSRRLISLKPPEKSGTDAQHPERPPPTARSARPSASPTPQRPPSRPPLGRPSQKGHSFLLDNRN